VGREHGAWKPWVTFHTFRHTCASLLFEAGRDVKQVAAWLGHADPGFTLRTYIHLMDAGIGDADFLDEAVKPMEWETAADTACVSGDTFTAGLSGQPLSASPPG
jgi:Phage integrase family